MCNIHGNDKSSTGCLSQMNSKPLKHERARGRRREPEVEERQVGRRRRKGKRWSEERGEEKERESVTISPLINIFSVPTEDTERERERILSSFSACLSLSLSVANMRR